MRNLSLRLTEIKKLFAVFAVCFISPLLIGTAFADDWPAWMGADRDGVYRESGVVKSIPESGLKSQMADADRGRLRWAGCGGWSGCRF